MIKNKIAPTTFGLYFIFFLLILFFLSFVYGHPYAYVMAFLFFALGLSALVQMRPLFSELSFLESEKGQEIVLYPGEDLKLSFKNQSKNSLDVSIFIPELLLEVGGGRLKAEGISTLSIPLEKISRGVYYLTFLKLEVKDMYGLYRASRVTPYSRTLYVPPHVTGEGQERSAFVKVGGNFEEENFRMYQKGIDEYHGSKKMEDLNSLSTRIDWKRYFRSGELFEKIFVRNRGEQIPVLNIYDFPGDFEAKLSALCAFGHELFQGGEVYKVVVGRDEFLISEEIHYKEFLKYSAQVNEINI